MLHAALQQASQWGLLNARVGSCILAEDRILTSEDKFKIGRIKEFGTVWYMKLSELNAGQMSSRAKARILGVDTGTVKNQSLRLMKVPLHKEKKTANKIIIKRKNRTITPILH